MVYKHPFPSFEIPSNPGRTLSLLPVCPYGFTRLPVTSIIQVPVNMTLPSSSSDNHLTNHFDQISPLSVQRLQNFFCLFEPCHLCILANCFLFCCCNTSFKEISSFYTQFQPFVFFFTTTITHCTYA